MGGTCWISPINCLRSKAIESLSTLDEIGANIFSGVSASKELVEAPSFIEAKYLFYELDIGLLFLLPAYQCIQLRNQ